MTTAPEPEWLTVTEACEYLRISRRTLYRWRDRGLITLQRFGPRQLRVRRKEVEQPPQPLEAGDKRAALDARWEEWGRGADAVAAEIVSAHGIGSDSTAVIRNARGQADQRTDDWKERALIRHTPRPETDEGRAALIAQRQAWLREADAFRERLVAKRGQGSDSTPVIKAMRKRGDRETGGE
jgi:excisionase family DNA binding protein